jgi:hypothetical protein
MERPAVNSMTNSPARTLALPTQVMQRVHSFSRMNWSHEQSYAQLSRANVLECSGSSLLPEKYHARHLRQRAFLAKRLECARLAGAFAVEGRSVSQKAAASSRTPSASRKSVATKNCGLRKSFRGLMALALLAFSLAGRVTASPIAPEDHTTIILVVGAPGDAEHGTNFLKQAATWQKACAQADANAITIGLDSSGATNDYEMLRQTIACQPQTGFVQLWLVLIGHGTFDGKEARFNLRGPDVAASDLANWLKPFHRPIAVINTTACSGPFLAKLSATNRVIITATRSASEQSFARFGQYFVGALTDPQADLDHDGQVSLLEAFLTASRETSESYKVQGRLVTEHPLLEDNGDGLGTPPDWFRGLRATKKTSDGASPDGLLAQQFRLIPSPEERSLTPEQIAQRDALEKAVLMHREKKGQMTEEDYYGELEKLLIQLARCYSASNSVSNSAHAP